MLDAVMLCHTVHGAGRKPNCVSVCSPVASRLGRGSEAGEGHLIMSLARRTDSKGEPLQVEDDDRREQLPDV